MSGDAVAPGPGAVWLVWSEARTRALILAEGREAGLEVRAFESVRDALTVLAAGGAAPAALVLDAEDAARDPEGWAALRRALPRTRALAVTPQAVQAEVEGIDLRCPRPLEIGALIRQVSAVLSQAASTTE